MCGSCTPESTDASDAADTVESTTKPKGVARRGLLYGGLGTAGAVATAITSAGPVAADSHSGHRRSNARTKAVLVGTDGGPIWAAGAGRRGICTVIEVDSARYIVDFGHASAPGLADADVLGSRGGNDLSQFEAGFITHLHSDHVADISNFIIEGFLGGRSGPPFRLYGPGDRGALPHVVPSRRPTPEPFNPNEPTPGTEFMVRQVMSAFATDLNDRLFDGGSKPIHEAITAHNIALPEGVAVPVDGPPARMRPFIVHEDDHVRVSATLVDHGQMAPSFGYRFDSDHGSIVVSGDTTLSDNLMELADGCDLLLHEIVDYDYTVARIEARDDLSDEVKEARLTHLLGAHTTEKQLAELLDTVDVNTLVLHHMVPGELSDGGWRRVAKRLGRGRRTEVIAGQDNDAIGAR